LLSPPLPPFYCFSPSPPYTSFCLGSFIFVERGT
jgi:hypothetical protein